MRRRPKLSRDLDKEALTKKLAELLRSNPILAGLSDEEILSLAQRAQFETYEAGQVLTHTGDPNQGFYAIAEGQIRLIADEGTATQAEAYLFEGNLGGELILLTTGFPNVKEEAAVDSILAKFDKDTFEWLMEAPEVATRLNERAAFFR